MTNIDARREATKKGEDSAKLTGHQKAAIVLVALGPELAAKVLKQLDEDEIERLSWEIVNVDKVPDGQREAVLEEALRTASGRNPMARGGEAYARQVLSQALGAQRAQGIIERLSVPPGLKPFDFLADADLEQVANFLQGEHPQIIALVLSFLPPRKAAQVLSCLDEQLQADVAVRIANMERAQPEAIKRVEQVLRRKLSAGPSQYTPTGGTRFLVQLLNNTDRETEQNVLTKLESINAELANEVKELMFIFEDLVRLDDRSLQRVLREIEMRDLALALKNASEEIKERVFRNLSSRAADMLRDEIAVFGPVLRRVVVEAQQRIVSVARRLDEAGEIIVARRADDVIL